MSQKPRGVRDLEDMDTVFDALAHRSRRTILSILQARGGTMTSKEIAQRFECTWATTSRHLRILKNAGLVCVELDGREHVYQLNRERLLQIAGDWVRRFA